MLVNMAGNMLVIMHVNIVVYIGGNMPENILGNIHVNMFRFIDKPR